jgi:uncharacterized protein
MLLLSLIGIGCLLFVIVVGLYGSLEITGIPYFAVPYTPADFGWRFEAVRFPTSRGLTLTGWYLPAPTASPATILVQHGLGSNAGDMLPNTACLQRTGQWNVFYYNFRGHADSDGRRTSLGPLELEDMRAAIDFLKKRYPEASRHLGVYGFSLGAAVGLVGAARFPEIEAVVAESAFPSISRTVRHFARLFYGIPYFPFVPLALFFTSVRLGMRIGTFAPAEEIGRISPKPLLLIRAERDVRMPADDAEALWAGARDPKEQWIVAGADHGEPWMIAREAFESRLVDFFSRNLPRTS